MRQATFALLTLALSACATTTAETDGAAAPRTTSVSIPSSGGTGAAGSTNISVTRYGSSGPSVAVLGASADAAWQALPQVYQELGIPMGTQDPAQRLFGNRKVVASRQLGKQPMSRIVSCGNTAFGAPVADTYRIQLSVLTTVKAQESGSRLETSVQATASQPGVSGSAVECASTGWLEERIATGVKARTTG